MVVMGCDKLSPGCTHCWSLDMTKRYHNDGYVVNGEWTGKVTTHLDRLEAACKGKKPKVISLWNDLFHENVSFEELIDISQEIWDAGRTKGHKFLILTKRPERAAEFFRRFPYSGYPNNPYFYLGTTVESQDYEHRIAELLKVPGKRFLSLEPLLGPVNIWKYHAFKPGDPAYGWERQCSVITADRMRHCGGYPEHHGEGIDWVIVGPETGPKRRFCDPEWIRSIVEQCTAAGVPVWVKAMPIPHTSLKKTAPWDRTQDRISHDMNYWPEYARRRELPWTQPKSSPT